MGKVKKIKIPRDGQAEGQLPLAQQYLADQSTRKTSRVKNRNRTDVDNEFVDDKLSRKILGQARAQQEELQEEFGASESGSSRKQSATVNLGSKISDDASDSEDDLPAESDDCYEPIEIDEEDDKALSTFMSDNPPARRTLADIIMGKITEKQTEIRSQMSDNASVNLEEVDERIVHMYRSIKDILAKYRSGKLPKAFKVIPALKNWEQILYITAPETWSAATMYEATRLFSSNLNAKMAQRFYNLVLYPRIRDDIAEYKRLNFHLYQALRKSLFKPAAFFKGVLLPICEAGDCTLREAIILSSILAKNSIPMLHSAAAILKIAEMDYNGANSIFLKTLLDKKYALPYRVIDAVVHHFLRFVMDKRDLPVLWHQSLLTFVQRYKEDISSEQKQSLMGLLRSKAHPKITPEIRRELVKSKCRDEEDAVPKDMDDD